MKRAAEVTTSQLHSDIEKATNDLSVLRKPIKTSINGLNEARKAFEDGTEEVRKLLSNECDIIYECKVCRNMFRSLANFISHKRVYCKATYSLSLNHDFHNDGQGFNQDISTIVQAEGDFLGTVKSSKNNEKDLSSIVERLIKREKTSRLLKLNDFYEQVNKKLTQDDIMRKRHVLHLDVVPESNVAVYQTVKDEHDTSDNIKTEVIEIQSIQNTDNSCTVLGPDGKVISPSELPTFPDDDEQIKLPQPFECEICNSKFATEKMLKLHIETKHITSTYVFQCPSCSKTFLQVGQVIRHLTNDHKKSMRRVRLMRDSILKRRTRIDEVQVKGPSRELARLQTDKERVDSQNKAWLDNLEDNENACKNVCLFCGRQFDRRAVLLSHHKVCQQKKKPNTRISLTRKVDHDRSQSTNGWNDREFDDSSNSNSLDGACIDDNILSALKEKPNKSIKIEPDVSEITSTNRRKRNRALKAIVNDESIQSDDEKSLNICWNADSAIKIKEENVSPIDDMNMSDSASNHTGDTDTLVKTSKFESTVVVKEEKRTRASANENTGKVIETKAKSKLSSSHCKYCFKKFSNPSNLRRHITMSHFGPKKFTCNLCTFRARRKIDILSHVRSKHQFGGERSDAFKFVTINDEPMPKPPPPSGVNRRKEKHTEVLRDDDEEIFIDSEPFIVDDASEQLLAPLGASNENSNTDLDDNSSNHIDDVVEQAETSKSNANLKRKGRPKAKDKPKGSARSLSPAESQKPDEILATRRPIRNRIMPVKKDFVYDLSTLLKKDYKDFQDEFPKQTISQPEQPQSQVTQVKSRNASPTPIDNKPNKRRQVLPITTEPIESEHQSNTDQSKEELRKLSLQPQTQQPPPPPPPQPQNHEQSTNKNESDTGVSIKGAADVMAQQAVQENRAVFSKPPELPAERPAANLQRQFEIDWPILKRPPAIFDGSKSKLSSLKVPGLKRKKRSCMLKHPSNTNYKKRSTDKLINGHTENRYKCNDLDDTAANTMKISSKLANKIQLKCAQIDNDNAKAIKSEVLSAQPVTSTNSLSPPASNKSQPDVAITTPRRMTLLERLAKIKNQESKTKNLNESLSRMTLHSIANSDNDSDED
ncbi:uncharacterized protein LOC116337400 [Contarinia nasturtii]|uniref:uncharacterized protein LOC116337400 n=1 Tax=Contarinia nasturtii TaxID=265458 RepID=UPI0012D4671E|nr:uncharacterized protein LOC116337400 [Contarinia nasturtii]XP_031617794.1 uncharacterized protein LOC116337400 [Contarinia nasturtii]XP_031617795.1 uncharacterized protein LOC116337400 [Contarinia nasturtii]XP_031617796.1 uncharacterized protein LOC116337400 [Contarinia nasturtii]